MRDNKGRFIKGNSGENNVRWKGDDVGYHGLHDWIERVAGKADHCELCSNPTKRFTWSSKNRNYKRDITEWWQLCMSCHKKYDLGLLRKDGWTPWNKGKPAPWAKNLPQSFRNKDPHTPEWYEAMKNMKTWNKGKTKEEEPRLRRPGNLANVIKALITRKNRGENVLDSTINMLQLKLLEHQKQNGIDEHIPNITKPNAGDNPSSK